MGKLTTHVLDTAHGCPAKGMKIVFSVLDQSRWKELKTLYTNADGRTEEPLLVGDAMKPGEYRLLFYVAEYYRSHGEKLPDPPFLDRVPIRFGIADVTAHYHVPLLASPWGYTTYRGS